MWGEHDSPGRGLRGVGVEVPEDQRTSTSSDVKDLDDDRAYELADAVAVLDAFHVVKLATQVVDDVRRRVQQDTRGHRGHRNDPLFRIRNILRAGDERLTDRQRARLTDAPPNAPG